MLLRRLALLALSGAAIACTVSPIPSSSPAPAGSRTVAEEPRVRAAVDRYVDDRATRGAEAEVAIASVDVTGDAAAVKVVETSAEDVHVDYLTLARNGGEWRIVNEVSTRATQ